MQQRARLDDLDAEDGVMDGKYFGARVPGSTKCAVRLCVGLHFTQSPRTVLQFVT